MGKPLIAAGIALIVAGTLLLGYLGLTVFRVIDTPQEVHLVTFITSQVRAEDKAIYGHLNHEPFEVNVSEPARTVILLLFAAVVLVVLVGVAKSLISAGISLVSAASRMQHDGAAPNSPGSSPVIRSD